MKGCQPPWELGWSEMLQAEGLKALQLLSGRIHHCCNSFAMHLLQNSYLREWWKSGPINKAVKFVTLVWLLQGRTRLREKHVSSFAESGQILTTGRSAFPTSRSQLSFSFQVFGWLMCLCAQKRGTGFNEMGKRKEQHLWPMGHFAGREQA